nr:MAG TPA: hypothetical protein [Caudoviricetes sp.]
MKTKHAGYFFLSTGTDTLPQWLLLSNQAQKENISCLTIAQTS